MINGLDVPTSGQVVVDGKELSKLKDEELTVFRRRKIGFIFQNYNLVPVLNVFENIVLPVELDGNKVDKKFMKEVVQMLGLEDKLNNMPNNLSGGQQQRVAIARALVSKPAIVLADEPTGNLDSKTSADVLGLLKTTSQKFHQTLVITHPTVKSPSLPTALFGSRMVRSCNKGGGTMNDILFGNNNKAVIKKLANHSFPPSNKMRNVIAVIAIALTTFLFTAVLTIGMGAKGTLEYNMAKMIGTGADALVQGLSEEQFQQLKENSMFEKVGCWVPIEIMTNTNRMVAEIDYADQPQLGLDADTAQVLRPKKHG